MMTRSVIWLSLSWMIYTATSGKETVLPALHAVPWFPAFIEGAR
jgi:hypothetical protein